MASIVEVSISNKKSVKKTPVHEATFLANYGMEDDAHATFGIKRQVSLLSLDSVQKMRDMGATVNPGDFAENLTVQDMELYTLPIGTRLKIGDEAEFIVSQIGKECHHGCDIFKQVGKCVMPTEGIFVTVAKGGKIKVGDEVTII